VEIDSNLRADDRLYCDICNIVIDRLLSRTLEGLKSVRKVWTSAENNGQFKEGKPEKLTRMRRDTQVPQQSGVKMQK
jgi:hypothetical protein